MSKTVATIRHVRGETISFGLRSTPVYLGTEIVTCDVKLALKGDTVPPEDAPVELSITPLFQSGEWLFIITAGQSALLAPGEYITDAKVLYVTGDVRRPLPLGIIILGGVTSI